MQLRWEDKTLQEQAQIIFECFPTLTDLQRKEVIGEWQKNTYPDSWTGHCQAMADLQNLANQITLSDEQKEGERQRLKEQIDLWLSK